MNKQEAIKKTEELEKQLAELKAIIEAPDTSELVFKPKQWEQINFIDGRGLIESTKYNEHIDYEYELVARGNSYKTHEDARNSAKYYIMNSDYDYWFPWSGQPKPKVLPKGLELWSIGNCRWLDCSYVDMNQIDGAYIYRWKRSEQV